jgi:hypothetical protein
VQGRAEEFDTLQNAFEREIKPKGIIEQMYMDDISSMDCLADPAPAAVQGGLDEFRLPQRIVGSSRAAFKGARPN